MRIANGVEMLEISANPMGRESVIHPVLIWDKDTVILVDGGFPGQLPLIRAAIDRAGASFNRLGMIILTHHDIDHIGSVGAISKELSGSVAVIAHQEEKPYINGERCPLKLARLEANRESLPDEMRLFYEKLKAGFQNSRVDVDKTVADGEELPCCGGITVVFTPGHTLGHICLYLNQSKILIAGDLLSIDNGMLAAARPSINYDTDLSRKSLKKLTDYDISKVICYHGGLYADEVNRRMKELADA